MGSFLSKLYTYDPLQQLGVSKYADPAMNAIMGGGDYTKSSGPGTPGPYAGVTPTLAAANAGYVAGGPGSNPGVGTNGMPVAGTPNVYAAAAQQNSAQPATGTSSINNLFGGQQPVNPAQRPIQPRGGYGY